MDFQDSQNTPAGFTQPQQMPPLPLMPAAQPPKKSIGWRIFWGILFVLSVLANGLMFLLLIGVVLFFAAEQKTGVIQQVIRDGPRTTRIAVVSVQGIIDDEQADDVYQQLKAAKEDRHVKGVILRVNSPGGTISGSDQIHNEILRYRNDQNKPVVAFMQGVAASGGYYTSVACDRIIAEPTTITGSIGVIMGYLVLEQLLQEKLGIQPVIVKAGEKKDWPSSFHPPTDEQLQYLNERIINPAYERFVAVVADGRDMLTEEQVRQLADGSIYTAPQAADVNLIDEIGYLDEAIEMACAMAGVEKAQVVEYRKPFSFADVFGQSSASAFKFNRNTLYELAVPQVLYLWTSYK